jgi:hypothetical protein
MRLATVFLIACGGSGSGPDSRQDATDTDSTSPTLPMPGTDEGFVFLFETAPHFHDNAPNITLAGLFVEDDLGIENLVQCIAFKESAWCADRLPTQDGDYVVAEDYEDEMLTELVALDIGPEIHLGPYSAGPYELGSKNAYFRSDLYGIDAPVGAVDLSFGDEDSRWGAFVGEDIVIVPDQLLLTQPPVMDYAMFEAGKPVELRWEPGTDGEVYIAVLNWKEDRLYRVADTGAFDLDLDDLQLFDGDAVEIRVGRWGTAELDHGGHELTVHYQRDQKIFGAYHDFGGRTEIEPPNTCAEAGAAPLLEPGNYWGDLAPLTNTQGPGLINSCTGFPAIGADAVFSIEVQHDEILDISYQLPQGDASVYLLETCGNPQSCLTGADTWVGIGSSAEEITYHNQTGGTEVLTLVLDAAIWTNSVFTLDLDSTLLISNVLTDSCVNAMSQGPISAGTYIGDMNGFSNILDPGPFGGPDAPAPEGLIQIELLPGASLDANVTMAGHDPVLYVLYNCAVAASLATSSDADSSSQEQIVYTNQSAASELVYLVVDGALSTGNYQFELLIQ